ncbi:MBL fold metallo-hydrolase [Halonotius terrestris]|uniref:MBL fold metallo-hydrolase n=1 Tax=Halonotius terrestris TaxID=2487750 RepID=A0A8J8PE42_9EURY|nr:rhodanese-like domain-containing protein [Halonotius terrestris]TQQ83691.1 MBL fold metallo-hydrolase [Halonotius terrestris]
MTRLISAEAFRDRLDSGESLTVVDTRDDEGFTEWRVPGAIQYTYKPFQAFDRAEFEAETGLGPEETIVMMCAKGKSSEALADDLTAAGYEDVTVVEGGMEAWSAVYDHVTIAYEDFTLVQLQRRAKGCLGYVVVSDGEAAVIDATRHTDEFRAAADHLDSEIVAVFDTHIHADHLSGGRQLAADLDVPYYLGEDAADRGVDYDYDALAANEVVQIGDLSIKALSTPGHTSEMVSYLLGDEAVVTGDTVFVDSVGRTELQFGDGEATTGAELLYNSLHRTLLAEPDAVNVLPGHFSVASDGTTPITHGEPVDTTIGTLRTTLDVLQSDREAFVERVTATLPEKPPNYETIIGINSGRDAADSEQAAIELELGPNRCAAEVDAD